MCSSTAKRGKLIEALPQIGFNNKKQKKLPQIHFNPSFYNLLITLQDQLPKLHKFCASIMNSNCKVVVVALRC